MLAAAGVAHEAVAPEVDEAELKARDPGLRADALALLLARAKAAAVAARRPDRLVLAADQVLQCEGELFDKPADRVAARAQLLRLRGRTHALLTAAVLFRDGTEIWNATVTARLTMREFSEAFLDAYLDAAGDDVLGSVGCYRLEAHGAHLMARIDGGHFAILGLPLPELLEALRGAGAVAA
jgi:septum formation protein